jgi:hypothetical protein
MRLAIILSTLAAQIEAANLDLEKQTVAYATAKRNKTEAEDRVLNLRIALERAEKASVAFKECSEDPILKALSNPGKLTTPATIIDVPAKVTPKVSLAKKPEVKVSSDRKARRKATRASAVKARKAAPKFDVSSARGRCESIISAAKKPMTAAEFLVIHRKQFPSSNAKATRCSLYGFAKKPSCNIHAAQGKGGLRVFYWAKK